MISRRKLTTEQSIPSMTTEINTNNKENSLRKSRHTNKRNEKFLDYEQFLFNRREFYELLSIPHLLKNQNHMERIRAAYYESLNQDRNYVKIKKDRFEEEERRKKWMDPKEKDENGRSSSYSKGTSSKHRFSVLINPLIRPIQSRNRSLGESSIWDNQKRAFDYVLNCITSKKELRISTAFDNHLDHNQSFNSYNYELFPTHADQRYTSLNTKSHSIAESKLNEYKDLLGKTKSFLDTNRSMRMSINKQGLESKITELNPDIQGANEITSAKEDHKQFQSNTESLFDIPIQSQRLISELSIQNVSNITFQASTKDIYTGQKINDEDEDNQDDEDNHHRLYNGYEMSSSTPNHFYSGGISNKEDQKSKGLDTILSVQGEYELGNNTYNPQDIANDDIVHDDGNGRSDIHSHDPNKKMGLNTIMITALDNENDELDGMMNVNNKNSETDLKNDEEKILGMSNEDSNSQQQQALEKNHQENRYKNENQIQQQSQLKHKGISKSQKPSKVNENNKSYSETPKNLGLIKRKDYNKPAFNVNLQNITKRNASMTSDDNFLKETNQYGSKGNKKKFCFPPLGLHLNINSTNSSNMELLKGNITGMSPIDITSSIKHSETTYKSNIQLDDKKEMNAIRIGYHEARKKAILEVSKVLAKAGGYNQVSPRETVERLLAKKKLKVHQLLLQQRTGKRIQKNIIPQTKREYDTLKEYIANDSNVQLS